MTWDSVVDGILGNGLWWPIGALIVFLYTKGKAKYLESHKNNETTEKLIKDFCDELRDKKFKLSYEELNTALRVLNALNETVEGTNKKRDGDIKFCFILIFSSVIGTIVGKDTQLFYFFGMSIGLIVLYIFYVMGMYYFSPSGRLGAKASKEMTDAYLTLNVVALHMLYAHCKSLNPPAPMDPTPNKALSQ